jgi:predicted RNase H-like HicB family nuclease
MASSTADGDDDGPVQEIRLVNDGEWWVATDVETGVTSQGESRAEALENLDEAVALHKGEIGRPPTDEELREIGIEPEDNTTGSQEPPDVLE